MRLKVRLGTEQKGIKLIFGELESEIMEILWEKGEAKGKEINQQLKRNIAYTTVLTVLERLRKKGFVEKRKEGRTFIFSPQIKKENFEAFLTKQLIKSAINISPELAISTFADIFSEMDIKEVKKISDLIEEKLNVRNKKD
ncbi:MAG: BlaI/MecI/CopY family transcriptional regulator [Candidatus Aminicenantia bacterium]